MNEKRAVILLGGPTAVGKSDVAEKLAERIGGEIISVDSMQVYRGMDIGTAKPSLEARRRIVHHLIDIVDLDEEFEAARFLDNSTKAADDIKARGHTPILSGGTGLYFQAFLEGLGGAPKKDAALRNELEALSLRELNQELEERDPVMAAMVDRYNKRRVLRAVEVIRLTGKPYSKQRAKWQLRAKGAECGRESSGEGTFFLALERSIDELVARIDGRVDSMFERGLVRETEELLSLGLSENQTARQAIGYRQVIDYLDGKRSLDETIKLVKQRTRQFAKRQMTWFRKQQNVIWLEAGGANQTNRIVDRIAGKVAIWRST